jgi:hypothetical protein
MDPRHGEPESRTLSLSIRKFLTRFGVDGAVGFAVLSRFWQLLTGPLTQLLIVFSFSKASQDYYYAFGNMLSMQIFIELGLSVVLINLASHEWATLRLVDGRINGPPEAIARLVSLGQFMFRWYGAASIVFGIVVCSAGVLFFGDTSRLRQTTGVSTEAVSWVLPWVLLVAINALQLWLLPRTALLEGCGQLGTINRCRFWQSVLGSLTVWFVMAMGLGLWSLVAASAVRLCGEWWLAFGMYRRFFAPFRVIQNAGQLDWRTEILPLQWRLAVQGSVMWFSSQMPGLILLRQAEGETGRLGMTMTILTALQSASMAWIETRRPLFGSLIARKEFEELDRQFFRMTRISMLLLTGALTCFSLAVIWMGTRDEWLFVGLSGRMLPAMPTIVFSVAFIAYQFVMCSGIYVRAHRRDPYLVTTVVSCLIIASLQLVLGRSYGSLGLAIGYAAGILAVQFPLGTLIWWQSRREWH